jgi:tryptophanyl-tRNA synthetase
MEKDSKDGRKRILTGYRPTGKLHLGHLHGNLGRMLELQEEAECFFFIADWHALTTEYKETEPLHRYVEEMVLDWLAVGLDPEKAYIYRQSDLPEIAELFLALSMIIPLAWLERVPTYKEQLVQLNHKEINTFGFLGYPALQAADILSVQADAVPVGEDQLPHLELTREIARRFNFLYGDYFSEPASMLSKFTRIVGIDGRKMSKSYDNAITLNDSPEEISSRVREMITDPARQTRKDSGDPDKCTAVYQLQKIYSPDRLDEIGENCRTAGWGCVDCKKLLAERVIDSLAGFRQRRAELDARPGAAWEVLEEGRRRVQPIVGGVLGGARAKMGL